MTHESSTRAGVSLRQLLAHEAHGTVVPPVRATSCTSDWRLVRPGDVFVAVTEADHDGHDHALEAAKRGATAVICERPLPVFTVPQCVVADSRAVFGRLCQALVGNPSRQLKVIGVAGTHGKTTVARLLTAILHAAGHTTGTVDSYGSWDGLEDRPPLDGSLTAPYLARSLAQMAAAGASHAVLELSSRELSQQTPAGVTLDAACITHVGRKHLAWHGSVENYRRAQQQIFDHLSPDGVAILNADDAISIRMLGEIDRPALTFGLKNPAEVSAAVIEQHINEQTFVLTAGDESVGVRTTLIGDHHIYNCLAAATTALAYGVDLATIARGLEAVDFLPGRMERVACGQNFAVLVDAADSPDALRTCLRTARMATSGRVICVFGAHADSSDLEWQPMGRVIGSMADVAVVTSNASPEIVGNECVELVRGFVDRHKVRVVNRRDEAIAAALANARSGDTVVVAGMGECTYCLPDELDLPVTDSEVVRRLLQGTPTPTTQLRMAA